MLPSHFTAADPSSSASDCPASIRTTCARTSRARWWICFPDPEHLDMANFEQTRRWGDEVDAELLVTCATPKNRHGGLKSLVLARSVHVIAKTLQTVLAFHTATLVDLNLLGCSTITTANLQTILCSCPCLRSLIALGETPNHPSPALWNIEKNRSDPCLD